MMDDMLWNGLSEFGSKLRKQNLSLYDEVEVVLWYRQPEKGVMCLTLADDLEMAGLYNSTGAYSLLTNAGFHLPKSAGASLSYELSKGGHVINIRHIDELDRKYRPLLPGPCGK